MYKKILSIVCCGLSFAACNKSGGGSSNSFKIGSSSYTPLTVHRNQDAFQAVASGGSLTIQFGKGYPTTSGTYKIVYHAKAADELEISAGQSTSTTSAVAFMTTGLDNKTATATVNNGKLTLVIPDVWAKGILGNTDSVLVSANVTEF